MTLNIELERAHDVERAPLTERETEILRLIAQGHSSRKVADSLVVSKRTIDFHLAHAYRKLGVSNRVQALLAAVRLGLIPTIPGTRGRSR